jgi:two-component system, OmpR family, sensor histidine kinase ArlS
MAQKLLNRTFRIYILCSIAVIILAAPLFYFSLNRLYIEEADETLLLHKKEFHHYYLPHFKLLEIENWNRYNRDMKIEPMTFTISSDTIFNKNYLDTLDNENEPYRVLQSPILIEGKPYIFSGRISLVEAEDLIESIIIVFISLIALLLGVLLFVTSRFSKRIWQPFQNTLHKLKSFELTEHKTIELEKTDIEEFEELNQSLQKLIDKNILAYSQQKTFIENASHELQTPLAVLKSKMDLLLQNKDLTNEQSEILNAVELPLSRISRVNKNLLLLAKIENSQFADTESIEVSVTLAQSIELLADYIQNKNLHLTNETKQPLIITCNKLLLEILLSNLLTNAIRHTSEGTQIIIRLKDNTLQIQNTGTQALNTGKLFERFAVSSSETTSSGLGLAIVKEICNRYQWQINYTFENNLHSFSVGFS